MLRSALATILLAFGLLLLPVMAGSGDAGAQVNININIGTNISGGRSITCAEGERILRNRGFREVRRVDCRGRNFVYRAVRGGFRYEIVLRARDGRVMNVRRLGRR